MKICEIFSKYSFLKLYSNKLILTASFESSIYHVHPNWLYTTIILLKIVPICKDTAFILTCNFCIIKHNHATKFHGTSKMADTLQFSAFGLAFSKRKPRILTVRFSTSIHSRGATPPGCESMTPIVLYIIRHLLHLFATCAKGQNHRTKILNTFWYKMLI